MSIKKEELVDNFLQDHNMDFLYCILADKESTRLSALPDSVKRTFEEKITTMALKHVAKNYVPEYAIQEIETQNTRDDDDYQELDEDEYDNLMNYDDDSYEDDEGDEES
jgi:hypothetical protein